MTYEKKAVVWTLKGFDGDKTFYFFLIKKYFMIFEFVWRVIS